MRLASRLTLIFCLVSFLWTSESCWAQSTRQIQAKIEKGNWNGAFQQLQKSYRKDTGSIDLKWLLAQWYFAPANPNQQIDSAYRYLGKTKSSFASTTDKQRERLKRQSIDESAIQSLKVKVDSMAFNRAKQINSLKGYDDFITRYTSAREMSMAVELRDEVAFLEALKVNTFQSFQQYLEQYPKSHRMAEAKQRFEELLFETKTRDQKLASYINFSKSFPASPYGTQADKAIFEITTALGDTTSFQSFIKAFPDNKFRKKAIDWLYYLYADSEKELPQQWMTDSLHAVKKLRENFWVPILTNGKFGFIDSKGPEVMPPRFGGIDSDYLCGLVEDDLISTSEGLFNRNGTKIVEASPILQLLELGFVKAGDSTCLKLIHASGAASINQCADDYQIIGSRFIFSIRKEVGNLLTLSGKQLVPGEWDEAHWLENVLVLSRLGKKTLYTQVQLAQLADGNRPTTEYVFDDVRVAAPDRLLVRNGSLEGLVNSQLEFIVPLDRQVLSLEPFGLVRKVNDDFFLDAVSSKLANQHYKKYLFNRQWLLVSNINQQRLFDLRTKQFLPEADSCWFAAGLAFSKRNDSTTIYFNSSNRLSFLNERKVTLIPSRDSIHAFYTVESKIKKAVYDVIDGKKLFTIDFDFIESINQQLFMVTRKSKKGIINRDGKVILPIEYEALALNQAHYWSTFKDRKFGLIDFKTGKILKPISIKSVAVQDERTLIVFKDGFYGLMDWQAKPITPFAYEEILPWKDNMIWVKKNFLWSLIDFVSGKVIIDKIKRFDKLVDTEASKIYRVQHENFFGIVTTHTGIIIPPTFSAIVNVGSSEEPLYFTDKEVEEAGVHVVIYYDAFGKFLRKQVYEEEEYERILCEK
jgi:WG containing repeat